MDRDANLLFGVFAVQIGKISPVQLVDAAASWATDPSRDLGSRLVEMGAMAAQDRDLVQGFVDQAVAAHGGDVSATLVSFGGQEAVDVSFRGTIVLTESGGVMARERPAPVLDLDGASLAGVNEAPGRYAYVREYARGGMGRILLVHDAYLGREVALKELLPGRLDTPGDDRAISPGQLGTPAFARLVREARITGQLEHPSIVPVYELGYREDGTLYYTMKFVRGRTLRQAISEASGLDERLRLLGHFIDLCQAIAYAHSRRVLHRDIKPRNVMVGEFGETVVLDWGLAKAKDAEDVRADGDAPTMRMMYIGEEAEVAKTQDGEALGTPIYMSPEQAKGQLGQIDERSDVYSLGAVLYEIITGIPPFKGASSEQVIRQVLEEEPKAIASIAPNAPPELVAICRRAMAKDPASRYPAAQDIAEEIQRFLAGALVRSYAYRRSERLRRFIRRNRALVLASTIGLLVLTVVNFLYMFRLVEAERVEQRLRRTSEQRAYSSCISLASNLMKSGDYAGAIRVLGEAPESLRDWEWGYLQGQCSEELCELNSVFHEPDAAFSPDGRFILLSNWQGTVAHVFDAQAGRRIAALESDTCFRSPVFTPDSTAVVAVSGHRFLFWDPETGDLTRTVALQSDGLTGVVEPYAIATDPDGASVFASYLGSRAVAMWDARTGACRLFLGEATRDARKPYKSNVKKSGVLQFPFSDPYDRSGDTLPNITALGTLSSRDIYEADGQMLLHWPESGEYFETDNLTRAAFAPGRGYLLLAEPEKRMLSLWNLKTDSFLWRSDRIGRVRDIAFSPDGAWAIVQGGWAEQVPPLSVIDVRTGSRVPHMQGWGYSIHSAFSPDSARVVLGTDKNTATVFRVESPAASVLLVGHADRVSCAAFVGDGTRVVTGSLDGTLRLWDSTTGRLLRTFAGSHTEVRTLAVDQDGARVVTTTQGDQVLLWDLKGSRGFGSNRVVLKAKACSPLSPSGRRVLALDDDDMVRIHDTRDGGLVCTLEHGIGALHATVFSPDDRRLLTLSEDDSAMIWDATKGQVVGRIQDFEGDIERTRLSARGNYLLTRTASSRVRLWQIAETPRELFFGPFGENWESDLPVADAFVAPDESRIAVAYRYLGIPTSAANSIRDFVPDAGLWQLPSGTEIARMRYFGVSGDKDVLIGPKSALMIVQRRAGRLDGWDTVTARSCFSLPARCKERLSALSADGRHVLALGSQSFAVLSLDEGNWLPTAESQHGVFVTGLFSPGATRVLTVSSDHHVCVWNPQSGDCVLELSGIDARFSEDGMTLVIATGAGTIERLTAFPWRAEDLPGSPDSAWQARLSRWKRRSLLANNE